MEIGLNENGKKIIKTAKQQNKTAQIVIILSSFNLQGIFKRGGGKEKAKAREIS
jgi:hypothetical protein